MQQSLPPNSSHNHHQSYMDPTDSSRRSHRPSLAEFRHPGFTDPSQSSYDPNPPQSYDQQVDPNGLTSAGSSRRGTKRRKDSALAEAETSSRRGTQPGIGQGSNVVQGHIGSDDMRNGLMVGPGAGVNPEDIHPQLDFTAFDDETVAEYLERNNALPKFGHGSIHSVWDINVKSTDPRMLFIDEPEPIMTMLPGPLPHMYPPPARPSNPTRAPHQASSPMDREGRMAKRRSTAAASIAAAIEESIIMAKEEDKRRKREKREHEQEGREGTGEGEMQVDTVEGEDGKDLAVNEGEAGEIKDEDGSVNPSDSPPTLRRSNRKPLPAGTSLAITYRNTRSSPSPSPSVLSDTEPFIPILADLDLARKVLAERAGRHWRDALAAGGGATVQGPGVNPAFAGQVMMGGTGGMMREGEVVAEFLYSTRVKNKMLKVAGHGLTTSDILLERTSSYRSRMV